MKTQNGKFVLFLDLPEFAAWLDASSFSRVIRLLQCHHTYIPACGNFHDAHSPFGSQCEEETPPSHCMEILIVQSPEQTGSR
jgi:hypothetical protein